MKHAREDISDVQDEFFDEAPVVGAMKPAVDHLDHVPDRKELRRRRRNHGLIGVVMVLFLVAAVAGVATYIITDAQTRAETQRIVQEREREAQEAKDKAEAEAAAEAAQAKRDAIHNVSFSVSGVDYDQYATRIPLQVVGESTAGQTIDEVVFIDSTGTGLSVPAGKYTATVIASPMASTGMIYTISSPPMEFTISEDDEADVSSGLAVVMLPIDADKLKQEDIDTAYSWAIKDEKSASLAEGYKQAAETAMVESKKRKEREGSEERQRLAQEFASEYFTTVIFTNQDDDSDVASVGNWSDILMSYVVDGTKLADHIKKGPGKGYSAALEVGAPSADDNAKTATVPVKVTSSSKATPGWTLKSWDATMVCFFNENNRINKIKVTTPDGTKEY